jgi:hypothetical protein
VKGRSLLILVARRRRDLLIIRYKSYNSGRSLLRDLKS